MRRTAAQYSRRRYPWYEPKKNVLENEGGAELLAEYEAAAAADAEAEAAEAAAEAELDAMEEEEAMPAV